MNLVLPLIYTIYSSVSSFPKQRGIACSSHKHVRNSKIHVYNQQTIDTCHKQYLLLTVGPTRVRVVPLNLYLLIRIGISGPTGRTDPTSRTCVGRVGGVGRPPTVTDIQNKNFI